MIRIAVVVAVLSTFATTALGAEPASGGTGSSASASELARTLVPQATWSEGLKQIGENVQAQMRSHPGANLQYPADLPSKVRAELEGVLPYAALIEIHAKELSARYSEAELKEILAFCRSSTGQKWLQVMPQVSEKVSVETQRRVEQKMPEVMQRLAKLAKKGSSGGKH